MPRKSRSGEESTLAEKSADQDETLGPITRFPERLKMRRDQLELTQEDIAAKVGRTDSSISKWESGEREPSYTALMRLAAVLHVSVEWLIGAEGAPAPTLPHMKMSDVRKLTKSAVEIVAALVSLIPDGDDEAEKAAADALAAVGATPQSDRPSQRPPASKGRAQR